MIPDESPKIINPLICHVEFRCTGTVNEFVYDFVTLFLPFILIFIFILITM